MGKCSWLGEEAEAGWVNEPITTAVSRTQLPWNLGGWCRTPHCGPTLGPSCVLILQFCHTAGWRQLLEVLILSSSILPALGAKRTCSDGEEQVFADWHHQDMLKWQGRGAGRGWRGPTCICLYHQLSNFQHNRKPLNEIPRDAQAKYHETGVLEKNRNLFSHGSRG